MSRRDAPPVIAARCAMVLRSANATRPLESSERVIEGTVFQEKDGIFKRPIKK